MERRSVLISLALAAFVAGGLVVVIRNRRVPPQPGGVCSGDGWCWLRPLPQGKTLRSVWGTARNDVWAAGDTLLHFDGTAWSTVQAPLEPGERLRVVWGTSATDVWVAGEAVLHWDGKAWTKFPVADDSDHPALFGLGPQDAWMIETTGDGPETRSSLLHWDGKAWTARWGPDPRAVSALWASGAADAWAVGAEVGLKSSFLLRWSGTQWAQAPAPANGPRLVRATWGANRHDAWAAGENALLHWNGTAWKNAATQNGMQFIGLWGSSSANVFAAGYGGMLHWDGRAWTRSISTDEMHAVRSVWGSDANDIWAVGDGGMMFHSDGTAWKQYGSTGGWYLNSAFATGADEVWAVGGNGTALHVTGRDIALVKTGSTAALEAVWASGPADVWAAGSSGDAAGVVLRGGAAGLSPALGPLPGVSFFGLWGTGPSDVWAGARGSLWRWDGARWQTLGPRDVAGPVWACGPNDVWALQDSTQGGPNAPGGVYHYDGAQWTLTQSGSSKSLHKLFGVASGDLWAAGEDPTQVFHFVNGAWHAVPTGFDPSRAGVSAVWGASPNDAWVSTFGGSIVHWNGQALSAPEHAAAFSVSSLSGRGGRVWAVGPDGELLVHRN